MLHSGWKPIASASFRCMGSHRGIFCCDNDAICALSALCWSLAFPKGKFPLTPDRLGPKHFWSARSRRFWKVRRYTRNAKNREPRLAFPVRSTRKQRRRKNNELFVLGFGIYGYAPWYSEQTIQQA